MLKMIMNKKIFHSLCYLFIVLTVNAQDLHFSNFQGFSNYFNPATTGIQAEALTVGIQYRSQWAKIPTAYRTYGVHAQKRLKRIGLGGLLHNNGAEKGTLQTTGAQINAALFQPLFKGDNELAIGLSMGLLQKKFDPALLSFDTQFESGMGYDATLSNRENFVKTTTSRLDFSIGAVWSGQLPIQKNITAQVGFSLAHVHLPSFGFKETLSELPYKFVAHGQFSLPISTKNSMSPYVLYQKQGVHRALLIGQNSKRKINERVSLQSGIAYRFKDAIIFHGGVVWDNKSLLLSYDLTSSKLSAAARGLGTFELTFVYKFEDIKRNKKFKDRDKDGIYDHLDKCPTVPGTKEYRGCPTPEELASIDSDGDGVVDEEDDCPFIPGYKLFYGCPDADKDGIPDIKDACPELAGSVNNHGCPLSEKDTDKDGIYDVNDYCVFLPGLAKFHGCPDSDKDDISDIDDDCPYLKGDKSNNGCPDNNKQTHKNLSALVEFDTDQHFIHQEYALELAYLANEVQTLQEYTIIIAGHTDSEGDAAYNYALGQRRAFAIKDFLINKGITSSLIRTISYGEAMPKRANESSTSKAKNRRAEVRVVFE